MRRASFVAVASAIVIVVSGAAACSSFSTGQGNTSTGGVSDAGNDQSSSNLIEGGNPTGPFCAGRTTALFCRDFDSVTTPTEGWGRMTNTANISLTTSDKSPPKAARFQFDENEDKDNKRSANLEAPVALKDGQGVDYEFDVFFEKPDWAAGHTNIGIASFVAERAQQEPYEIFIIVEPTQFTLRTHLGIEDSRTKASIWPYDQWVHVKLALGTPAPAQVPIQLFLNGSLAIDMPANDRAPNGPFDAHYVGIGLLDFNPPSPPFDIRFDNVELTSKP